MIITARTLNMNISDEKTSNSEEIQQNNEDFDSELINAEETTVIPQFDIQNIITTIQTLDNNDTSSISEDSQLDKTLILKFGAGHDHTKYIGAFGHIINPIKDKFHQWTAYLTHPNVGISSFIKKPVILLQKLHQKGANLLAGANGVLFGADEFTDYPYPYRKVIGVVEKVDKGVGVKNVDEND